jgi:hypothetical protein
VGKIETSICYDALLGGMMVFVSPLSYVSHSQMQTSINNFENGRSFDGSLVRSSNGSCCPLLHLTPRGHPLMCHLCPNLNSHQTYNIKTTYSFRMSWGWCQVVFGGISYWCKCTPSFWPIPLLIGCFICYEQTSMSFNVIHMMMQITLVPRCDK